MDDLSNSDKLRILRKRQQCPYMHEYTCDNDACRGVLTPVERDGKVLLVCTYCKQWEQEAPHVTLQDEVYIDALCSAHEKK